MITNEHGNEVSISVSSGPTKDDFTIRLVGPDSETTNSITRREAEILQQQLSTWLSIETPAARTELPEDGIDEILKQFPLCDDEDNACIDHIKGFIEYARYLGRERAFAQQEARVQREQCVAAEARCEELASDAERYRWLRLQNWNTSPLCVVVQPKEAVKLGHDCPSGDRLDIAIDFAREVK